MWNYLSSEKIEVSAYVYLVPDETVSTDGKFLAFKCSAHSENTLTIQKFINAVQNFKAKVGDQLNLHTVYVCLNGRMTNDMKRERQWSSWSFDFKILKLSAYYLANGIDISSLCTIEAVYWSAVTNWNICGYRRDQIWQSGRSALEQKVKPFREVEIQPVRLVGSMTAERKHSTVLCEKCPVNFLNSSKIHVISCSPGNLISSAFSLWRSWSSLGLLRSFFFLFWDEWSFHDLFELSQAKITDPKLLIRI